MVLAGDAWIPTGDRRSKSNLTPGSWAGRALKTFRLKIENGEMLPYSLLLNSIAIYNNKIFYLRLKQKIKKTSAALKRIVGQH